MSNRIKKLSIFLLVMLVASAIGFSLYKRTQSSKGPLRAAGSEHVIELKEDGFSPEELTIQKGDIVIFKTTKGSYFWPASNLHPTHTIYPEFDSEEPIGPDESWSFRFEEPGEWMYHDHLAPYFTGKITVVDEVQASSQGSSKCANEENTYLCVRESLLGTLEERGLDATFDHLAELYVTIPGFGTACHTLTHDIGVAAYKLFVKNKDSILTQKAAYCANGFYHGFMESFLTATRDPQAAKAFCAYVDQKLTQYAPDAALQCYHGIGHGAMDLAILSLFEEGIERDERSLVTPALQLCEEASDTKKQLYRCASGVFNGIANFYVTGEFGLTANIENPLQLCDEQLDKHKESCYGNMNTILRWIAEDDFQKAARFIEQIPDREYAPSALRYLANMYTLSLARGNYRGAIENCRMLDESLRVPCIEGFAHGFLEQGVPGEEYLEALAFCRADALSGEEREICFRYALNLDGWYDREKARIICETVEEEYREYCNKT